MVSLRRPLADQAGTCGDMDAEPGIDGARRGMRLLAATPWLADVDQATVRGLAVALVERTLVAGERVFARDDDLHGLAVVVSGSLRLMRAAGQTPSVVSLGPGSMFADRGLPVYVPVTIEALQAATIAVVPWAALAAACDAQPVVRARVVAETVRHLRRLQIASTPLFHSLDEASVSQVAEHSTLVGVKRGDVVLRAGDDSDCLYLIATGTLELLRDGKPLGVLGEGASVGEMGVLTREPRSLDVRARRDSTLVRVPAAVFDRVLDQHGPVTLRLAHALSDRLKQTTAGAAPRPVPISTIAVLRACAEPAFEAFREHLMQAFARAGHRTAAMACPPDDAPLDDYRLSTALADAEQSHRYVVCACDQRVPAYTRWSLSQADLILIVAAPGAAPPAYEWSRELDQARAQGSRVELVLVRAPDTSPHDTGIWLDAVTAETHHHLVAGSAPDHDRLVRRVSGRAWGLVLGGGGARGFAHIGVIRALREAGVPIDMVGGTSMGAILAAQYAMGADDRQMLEMSRRAYVGGSSLNDLTMPLVSLRTGRATMRTLKAMFGDRAIEDLPTPYFCVSCNLTRARVEFHDRGPAWFWARVSCSVPGLLPPVPFRGDLLVDGGLLDNLPVAEMRRRLGGQVVAANVSVGIDLPVAAALTPEAPWSGSAQLLRMITGRPRLPNIVDVLLRTAEISSVRDSNASGSPANLYLHVPVGDVAMSDFHAIDRLVTMGYDYTARRIEEHRTRHGRDAC